MVKSQKEIAMKRSEINLRIREGIAFFDRMGFKLPPFAFFTREDWQKEAADAAETASGPDRRRMPIAPGPAGVATAAMVSVVLSIRTILLPGGALRQETQRFLQKIFLCKLGGKNPLTGVMKTAGLHTDSREST